MEPNMKLLIEDLMKQLRDEIEQSCEEIVVNFTMHSEAINKRVSDLVEAYQVQDEHVTRLKMAASAFDKSFTSWKPEVEASLDSIKLQLAKLNSFFNYDAKHVAVSKLEVLHIKLAYDHPQAGSRTDDPNGHRSDSTHWDCGFGIVYTQIHDPVKGTMFPPPPHSILQQPEFTLGRDPFHFRGPPNHDTRSLTGKLPKMSFPKFDGENPKLWLSCCESYFDMYSVDSSIWVKVASMHFEGAAARWLQSIDHHVRTAT
jgi:hypothetical protein